MPVVLLSIYIIMRIIIYYVYTSYTASYPYRIVPVFRMLYTSYCNTLIANPNNTHTKFAHGPK